ncbi:uncharacterized protein YbdG [Salmonella enterica subsp. enterica serovar Inverness str. R8-3668]|uniref:Mechanosensing system component YbdG n=1 Tax=Salmonella enterica subsp. enterica serovar Inverness str. R8-3668 TaxID=913075 RepID=G5N957_SALET|nr:uncharacterized protein YbdG [Salmonella enterica subsp. enterica serovar Inverness str. R8-3668]
MVFKDPILGLVAGIQLSANDMLKLGDWLEMPKYGADGAVIDIGLTTVKVRNWDNTITTIPTWSLVSDSFKNWSGMSASGGPADAGLNAARPADAGLNAALILTRPVSIFWMMMKNSGC